MPNHCLNRITIYGKNLKEFFDKAIAIPKKCKPGMFPIDDEEIAELICLDSLVPLPEEVYSRTYGAEEETREWEENGKIGEEPISCHEKQCELWGTKWGLYKFDMGIDEVLALLDSGITEITINCSSAWDFPHTAFKTISKNFPELTFDVQYFEPGMVFGGVKTFKNGEITSHDFSELEMRTEYPEFFEEEGEENG